jgi:hypothetical protein
VEVKIPEPISEAIDHACSRVSEPRRPHLGCSTIGDECERRTWLRFRWTEPRTVDGRLRRIFDRGRREEEPMASYLRLAGMDVTKTGDDQTVISFGCHVGGSVDGIIESGVPGAEKARHVWENKTHSLKSFQSLQKYGVRESKPMHYAQCQLYMLGTGVDRTLYTGVCKDDDSIYCERLKADKSVAISLVEKGKRLALSDDMPPPIDGGSPTWFKCRSKPAEDGTSKYKCSLYDQCWGSRLVRQINCRTCANSTARPDSSWFCERYGKEIPSEAQDVERTCHVLHPDLTPWQFVSDGSTRRAFVFDASGVRIVNGDPKHGGATTRELIDEIEEHDSRAT